MIWLSSLRNSLLFLKGAFLAIPIALILLAATRAAKAFLLIDHTRFILTLGELPLSKYHLIPIADHDFVELGLIC